MREDALAGARRALARGDILIAFDEARRRLQADPTDVEAHWLVALTLARAGATERATVEAGRAQRAITADPHASPTLREDADALVARLAKDQALAATDPHERARLARHAASLYESAADRYGRHYSLGNAATLWFLAGDRDRAKVLAGRARELAALARTADPYWSWATDAEAALVLGDVAGARAALEAAAAIEPVDLGARAVTRRQLRLVCTAAGLDPALADLLAIPAVLHYCGRMIDADWDTVRADINAFIARTDVGVAFGSLAWGADLVIAECLLDAGVECNIVLPFAADEFETVSVQSGGTEWVARYRGALEAAHSVSYATDSAFGGDNDLFGYGSRVAMGRALNRAAHLDADAWQLAIWDGVRGADEAGTAHDLDIWAKTGNRHHVVRVPSDASATATSGRSGTTREIRAILFADFRGFSRLRDEHFPVFVAEALGELARALRSQGDDCLWCNTWGDAVQAIFRDVVSAARAALAMQDSVRALRLADAGLPADLAMRVGGHAGPVRRLPDPFTGTDMFWGRELTRAARIEPTTPEGEVYVTEEFAALLALEPHSSVRCEYVGRITTAKEFETIPMYRLRPIAAR